MRNHYDVKSMKQRLKLRQQLEARSGRVLESFKTREEARAALDEWFDVQLPVGETLSLDEINAEIQSYHRECVGSPAWPGIDIPD